MNVVMWIGFALWFPGVAGIFVAGQFKRWGAGDRAMEVALLVSAVGSALLAVSLPVVADDPIWKKVLYDLILGGWAILAIMVIYLIEQFRLVKKMSTQES